MSSHAYTSDIGIKSYLGSTECSFDLTVSNIRSFTLVLYTKFKLIFCLIQFCFVLLFYALTQWCKPNRYGLVLRQVKKVNVFLNCIVYIRKLYIMKHLLFVSIQITTTTVCSGTLCFYPRRKKNLSCVVSMWGLYYARSKTYPVL